MPTEGANFDPTAEPFDWDAIARYLAGESTPDEARAVRRWLDERPERAQLVAALERSFEQLAAEDASDVDVDGALAKVHARMAERPSLAVTRTDVPKFAPRIARPTPLWRRPAAWLAAAAAVAIVAVGVSRMHSAAPVALPKTYHTAIGARDSLRLPDGTRVTLGPGSRLTVANAYDLPRREVSLVGEAYFDVVHDAVHPFVVHAGGATIQDIGTAFTVHADSATMVRVAVTAGRVRLSRAADGDSGIVLVAGDAATLDTTLRLTRLPGSADTELAWTRGQLVFRDTPMRDVAADLRRWYGLELRFASPALAERHLTATFDRETPDQVLATIGAALGAELARHGDTADVRTATPGRRSPAR